MRPCAEGTATTVAEAGAERDRTSWHGDGEQPSGSAAGAESRGTFSALRYRNFRLFFFGQLISLTGTWMDITAEGWDATEVEGDLRGRDGLVRYRKDGRIVADQMRGVKGTGLRPACAGQAAART